MKIKTRAYAVAQLGIIGLPTVAYTPRDARQYSIATEREYLTAEESHMTDSQIWKRLYRHGFRVVPVTIVHEHQAE